MNNAEIFLKPGQIVLDFLMSLFESPAAALDATLYIVLSGLIAIVVWSWTIRVVFEITKKAFGFEQRRY